MLERLLGSESRAVNRMALWGAGYDLTASTWAGRSVSYDTAFILTTTYASVRLISDTISTFPADTFERRAGQRVPYRPRPAWVTEPDSGVTMSDHLQQVIVSMLLSHGGCVRKYRNASGDVVALVPLDPMRVEPQRNERTGEVEYVWDGRVIIPAADMLYLPMLRRPGTVKGVSPLDELKQTFGSAAALDEFAARFFSNGSVMSGVIELPQVATKEQARAVRDTFEDSHRGSGRAHRTAVLGGGGKWIKTGVDPEQAQMLETRRFMVEEIARVFRVPLHMLQVAAPGVQSYASNEENAIQFAAYTLRPIVAKIEAAYSKLLPGEAFLRLNMDALLRGDLQSRFAAYSAGIQSGFMTINMINRLEDWPAVDGGDVYRVPLANVNLSAADLTEMDKKILMAQRLVVVGFDPTETMSALGLPNIAHTGLPSVQLQGVAQVEPTDPAAAYPVRELPDPVDTADIADAIATAIREVPAPVVNVNLPEPPVTPTRAKRIERDADGGRWRTNSS